MSKNRFVLIVVGLLLISVSIYVAIRLLGSQRRSPQNCVARVFQALKSRDDEMFTKCVDARSVATSVVDQLFALNEDNLRDEETTELASASGGATKDILRPMMYGETEHAMITMVKQGTAQVGTSDLARGQIRVHFADLWYRLLGTDTCFAGADSIRAANDEASAIVCFRPAWGTVRLELQMTRRENEWHVVAIKGVDAAIRQYNSRERARIDSLNSVVDKQIAENFTLEEIDVENRTLSNAFNRIPAFTIHPTIRNRFAQEVSSVNASLLFHFSPRGQWCGGRDRQYTDTVLPVVLEKSIAPQASTVCSIPITDRVRVQHSVFLYLWFRYVDTYLNDCERQSSINWRLRVHRITFSDGTVLEKQPVELLRIFS
jgi:hypothetical protein